MPAATPNELRASVVRMLALGLDMDLIIAVSGLCEKTIRTINKQWKENGLLRAPDHPVGGRPRLLDIGDLWVSLFKTDGV